MSSAATATRPRPDSGVFWMLKFGASLEFGAWRLVLSRLFHYQRIAAHLVTQFHKRHLGTQPQRVLGDRVHGLDSVVADQVKALTQNQERFKTGPHPVAGKFEVSGLKLSIEKSRSQSAGIGQEILLESLPPWTDVSQNGA